MFSVRDNDTLTTPGQPKLNCTFAIGFPSIFVSIISYHSMQDTVTSTEIWSQSPHNRTQTDTGYKDLTDQPHLLSMRWPLNVGRTYTGRTELVFMIKTVCFLQQRNIFFSDVLVILNIIIRSHLNHHHYHHHHHIIFAW